MHVLRNTVPAVVVLEKKKSIDIFVVAVQLLLFLSLCVHIFVHSFFSSRKYFFDFFYRLEYIRMCIFSCLKICIAL